MNDSKRVEVFENLENIEASKLGFKIGYLPSNVVPVIKKDQLDKNFIIYLVSKEEFELKGSWWKVRLAYSSSDNNIITIQDQNNLLTYSDLSEYPDNLLRLK